jgi:DNA-binding LacI/PurR family transcriptional regulator
LNISTLLTMAKKLTIRDVASAANVSIATISRVLNNSSVPSDEIRDRVQKIIEQLDYVPQKPGRKKRRPEEPSKARSRSTRTIGLVMAPRIFYDFSEGELYLARLINGIHEAVGSYDCNLRVFTHDGSQSIPPLITKTRMDGLLIDDHIPPAVQRTLKDLMPVVFIDSSPRGVAGSSVRPNFETAISDILTYLWDLGHRDIAMFKAANSPMINPPMMAAYSRFFAEHSYEPRVQSLNVPRDITSATHFQVMEQYAGDILAAPTRPTAVVAEDVYAARIHVELTKLGVTLPEAMSLVGIDDTTVALHLEPQLTSYRFPMDEIGKASIDELFQCIENPSRSPRQIFLDGKIIERASVAPPPDIVPGS